MKREVFNKIKKIVGSSRILTTREELICYSYDAMGIESLPEAVVFPDNVSEIASIVKLANHYKFPVFPRGAGSGTVGGAIPLGGGVVLALNRLNRILEIDVQNQLAVVEPGVVTGTLKERLRDKGLFYPPDPASLKFCTIGGNVATGAGGPQAVKYGVTYNYVLGLEAVMATGEIIHSGRRTVKGVVGYDLTSLLVGSEGTLGIFTKIILRLLPYPETRQTLLVIFEDIIQCMAAVDKILKMQMLPSTLEFMDKNSIEAVEKHFHLGLPESADALLLIEIDGDKEIVEIIKTRLVNTCQKFRPLEITFAKNEEEREEIWRVRRSVSPALLSLRPGKINEDVCVPRSRIAELVRQVTNIGKKHGILVANFGHAGDGNIHVNFLIDRQDSSELVRAEKAVKELFKMVLHLGGTISGEHGIGIAKSPFLTWEVGEEGVRIMKRLKKVFDPNNILNPGKMVNPNWAFFHPQKRL